MKTKPTIKWIIEFNSGEDDDEWDIIEDMWFETLNEAKKHVNAETDHSVYRYRIGKLIFKYQNETSLSTDNNKVKWNTEEDS